MTLVGVALAIVVVCGACGDDSDDQSGEHPTSAGVTGATLDKKGTEDPIDDESLEGITVTVFDSDGDEVGQDDSDADAIFFIEVPGPGTYTAVLDVEDLPDDVEIDDDTLEVEVEDEGHQALAVFPLNAP